MFYLSPVDAIGFADGVLPFKDLARLISTTKFKGSAMAEKYRKPLVTVLIDTCFSGGVVDAFKSPRPWRRFKGT